jgi:hypothetical protein
MDEGLVQFGLTAFVTPLVVVNPPGVVPVFVALLVALFLSSPDAACFQIGRDDSCLCD